MTNTKDIIIQLKQVREEKGLSLNDILSMVEEKEQYPPSRSTIQRLFAEGSENQSFKYEETIRPIANVLLDIENIEEEDGVDVRGMKVLLKYKIRRIEELEQQLDREKLRYHEKLDKEREQFRRSLDFLKNQIELKDKRIDQLMSNNSAFTNHIMNCPYRDK